MKYFAILLLLVPFVVSYADTPSQVVQAALQQHKTITQQWLHSTTQPTTQPATSQPAESFANRWLDAMLQTFFNFLNTQLQSQTTIANIESGIKALTLPPTSQPAG